MPPAAPSAHSIRAAVKMASAGSYGVSRRDGSTLTAYSAKVAGSNCIGPSAPLRFLPWWTPRAFDRPLSDSIVPIPASTSQVSPGQVRAAPRYQARYLAGTADRPGGLAAAAEPAASTAPAGSTAPAESATTVSAAAVPRQRRGPPRTPDRLGVRPGRRAVYTTHGVFMHYINAT